MAQEDSVNLTDRDQLLSGRHIASLGTVNPDDSVHLTAVWYVFQDDSLFIATFSRSRKARNVQERKKASLMVDIRKPGFERGVVAAGSAELITGDRSREFNQLIHQRYMSPAAIADPRVGPRLAALDDVTIKLTPASWSGWNMEELGQAMFQGAMNTPGYLLPLD
jgi:nitroimidazol reductase NimA-like FMN-containing flavoprotein (pyridoxamine 5'-phosphate oxidase superfamily)